jgi:formate dehydrogenase major subunit
VLESPGEARADWQVICEIAGRVGLPMSYASPAEVFDEFTSLTKNYKGLTHDNLGSTGKLWPCANPETDDGAQILFGDGFPTASGRGRFVPCLYQPADELPDEEYPFVLTTGRVLEHWHTGSMTRRSYVLNSIAPDAFAAMNPGDLSRLDLPADEMIAVSSRRGTIQLRVRSDDSIESGCVFIPFHFREAAANVLTTDALDPYGKIPEFKFCAVRVDVPATV